MRVMLFAVYSTMPVLSYLFFSVDQIILIDMLQHLCNMLGVMLFALSEIILVNGYYGQCCLCNVSFVASALLTR